MMHMSSASPRGRTPWENTRRNSLSLGWGKFVAFLYLERKGWGSSDFYNIIDSNPSLAHNY